MEEFIGRYAAFKQNILYSFTSVPKTYRTGITKFSDMTQQEFKKTYLNLDFSALSLINFHPVHIPPSNDPPERYDWRDNGYVFPARNQGSCSASWAFSTITNLEGLYAIGTGVPKKLSEQEIIDCDTEDSGCSGGLMQNAFEWLKENGVMLEEDYPYTGRKDTCKKDPSKYIDMKVTGYKKLGSSSSTWAEVDEEEMRDFLLVTGPLCAAMNANLLQFYTSGIIDGDKSQCSPGMINHSVAIVGYGVEAGIDYWIVKNSWGTSWGEQGFFRISRGKGTCGINMYIITGVVEF